MHEHSSKAYVHSLYGGDYGDINTSDRPFKDTQQTVNLEHHTMSECD